MDEVGEAWGAYTSPYRFTVVIMFISLDMLNRFCSYSNLIWVILYFRMTTKGLQVVSESSLTCYKSKSDCFKPSYTSYGSKQMKILNRVSRLYDLLYSIQVCILYILTESTAKSYQSVYITLVKRICAGSHRVQIGTTGSDMVKFKLVS